MEMGGCEVKIQIIIALCVLITGCDPAPARVEDTDQCLRAELFQQCLKSVPSGPLATKYNDWDEAIGQCESAAYHQSIRKIDQIKPECQP
jgi:hypothetical protein